MRICSKRYILGALDAQARLRVMQEDLLGRAPSELWASFHSSSSLICSFDLYCDAGKYHELPWEPETI